MTQPRQYIPSPQNEHKQTNRFKILAREYYVLSIIESTDTHVEFEVRVLNLATKQ
jgi:hypothetical protein